MLLEAIKIMGVGMGGVFIVLALFYGMIVLLGNLFPNKGDDK